MIRHFLIQRPPKQTPLPQWSLSLVLRALREPPFEPLHSISLKALTFKTVFLLALASGRRRSEIHALDTRSGFIQWRGDQVILRTDPRFLAKNQVLGSLAQPIIIKAIDSFVGSDRSERLLCPKRSLLWYLKRIKPFRGSRTRLFLPIPPSSSDISPAIISKWLVETVKWTYKVSSSSACKLERVTAHEVRALSASWALFSGVPVAQILQAGTWRSPNSFISFYIRDMTQEASKLQSLGPLSVGQSVVVNQRFSTR